jgi:hypothetical protein
MDLVAGDTVIGNHNQLDGRDYTVVGDHNTISGWHVMITGNHNKVYSSSGSVTGNQNHIHGDGNRVAGNYTTIMGMNNRIAELAPAADGRNVTIAMGSRTAIGRVDGNIVIRDGVMHVDGVTIGSMGGRGNTGTVVVVDDADATGTFIGVVGENQGAVAVGTQAAVVTDDPALGSSPSRTMVEASQRAVAADQRRAEADRREAGAARRAAEADEFVAEMQRRRYATAHQAAMARNQDAMARHQDAMARNQDAMVRRSTQHMIDSLNRTMAATDNQRDEWDRHMRLRRVSLRPPHGVTMVRGGFLPVVGGENRGTIIYNHMARPAAPPPITYPDAPAAPEASAPDDTPDAELCSICLDRRWTTTTVPCGHQYACVTCVRQSRPTVCAICKAAVTQVIRHYGAQT